MPWLVSDRGAVRRSTFVEDFALAMVTLGACIRAQAEAEGVLEAGLSQVEIAERFGVTRQRIEQIELGALRKLRGTTEGRAFIFAFAPDMATAARVLARSDVDNAKAETQHAKMQLVKKAWNERKRLARGETA